MMQVLEESGMRFPYQDSTCYMIEKSARVAKLQGVKIVEFVQAYGREKVVMVEAKTTAPQPKSESDYDDYLKEIREKFPNSISLLNAARLKRREDIFDELPSPLKNIDYKKVNYWLYLVIKKAKADWVINLKDDLRRQLHPFLKCWNIPDDNFVVVNEEMARTLHIVE